MKKILKTPGPNALTGYAVTHPDDSWDDFRDELAGASYGEIREQLREDQGGLCAYCECKPLASKEQVEHFVPKSTPGQNWGLDWDNLLMVCDGGSKGRQPLPGNLSCDQHRNHWEQTHTGQQDVLNPLELSAFPSRFVFHLADSTIRPADPSDSAAVNTIEVLNLNCPRLVDQRRQVIFEYNRMVKKARESNDGTFHERLAQRWFQTRWPSFFTTRRSILRDAAEDVLRSMNFDG